MRVGDVYRIKRMIRDGLDDKAIHDRFKNDYPEDEINKFIKGAKKSAPKATPKVVAEKEAAEKKPEKEAAEKKPKKDPLS